MLRPINISAADALHRRNKQGFSVAGLKSEKKVWTEDEERAHAVLRDTELAESRRRAIERGEWVDEVSGYILEEKDPIVFTEASDYISDLEKFVREIMDHGDGYGNTFALIEHLRIMIDESSDLYPDTTNMVLFGLDRLKEGWLEQAGKCHTQQGKASEE